MRSRAFVLAALISFVPVAAHAAPAKAWAAAKASLPASTEILVGFDFVKLRSTSVFGLAYAMLVAQVPDVKAALDQIKSVCAMDPYKLIDGVVVGMHQDKKQGAVFLALAKGVNEAKVLSCATKIATANAEKLVTTKTGTTTEIALDANKLYVSWIGKDVLVVPLTFGDKAQLATWTGGNKALTKGGAGGIASKINTASAMWAVMNVPQDVDGTKMTAGYGALSTTKGTFGADLHLVFESTASAKATADKASQELKTMATGKQLDAKLATILKQIIVTATGSEVVVKASIPEADVLGLAGSLLRPAGP